MSIDSTGVYLVFSSQYPPKTGIRDAAHPPGPAIETRRNLALSAPQASLTGLFEGIGGSKRAFAAAPQAVGRLEEFVKSVEKENLANKKKAYAADQTRDKEHDSFWAAQRAKYESWDAEASRANVDPMVYTAVKEMEAVESFKVRYPPPQ